MQNSFPMREWHFENMEKTVVKYVVGHVVAFIISRSSDPTNDALSVSLWIDETEAHGWYGLHAISSGYTSKMTCKGICVRHKAMKPVGTGRYSTGQKRCQVCEIFLKWDGFWCPCCGYRLRTRPRNMKFKAEMRARKNIEEYQLLLQQQQRKRRR